MVPVSPLLLLGLACSDSTIKTFTEPPTVTIVTPPADSHVDQSVDVVLTGLVTDSEYSTSLSSLDPRWSVDGEAICDGAVVDDGGNVECVWAFDDYGDHVLRLTVTNPDGASATAENAFVVDPNGAPTATITAPEPGAILYSDQLVYFEAAVADTEDPPGELTAYWNSSLDGDLEVESTPTDAGDLSGATLLSEGEHLITLTVEDTTGLTGEDTILLQVGAPNSAPDCQITSPTNNESFELGSTVLFEGTASDVDISASLLDVEWKSNLDGVLSTDSPTSSGDMSFGAGDLSQGTHTITLTVYDEIGASCSDAILVTMGSGPSITITEPTTGDVFNEGSSIAFSATAIDADDSPTALDITWESDIDGPLSTAGADSSGVTEFTSRSLSSGEHTITVTAVDPDDYYGNDSIRLTVNGLPSAPGVSIDPDPATSGDNLTATITTESVDPEGDSVSYLYQWYVNGTSTSYTTEEVPASATTRGDTWRVEVMASDGLGESDVGTASVDIANSPPGLDSVTISPTAPTEADTLTCVPGTATDPDGDSISYSYAWSVGGSGVSVTTNTLSSSYFSRGDVVTCTVTPSDGTADGDPVTSDPVEIGNSAPSVASVSLSPRTAYEASTLTCTPGDSSDPDGDKVTYSYDWIVEGVRLGLDTDTLDGTWFDKHEEVTCEVTPHDDSAAGDPVESNTVTVSNTAPTVSEATLSPSSPTESSTLVCSAGTRADDDGDAVSVSYGWLVNGAEISATGSSLTGSEFDRGDTVACTVTPNDGEDDGEAVTSSTVTVANTAPTLASVSISPSDPTEESTLTCTPGTSSDVDGDAVSYVYAWNVSGVDAGVTVATLTGDDFDKGDTVYCTVTPYDGTDLGTGVNSGTVTVANTPPSIGTLTLSPTEAYEASTLTCSPGSTSDVDGDSISYTYNWTVGGSSLGLDSSTLDGTWFAKGDTVVCSATPSDGEDSGDTATSNTITIQNTPPEVSSVSITPTTGTESTTFTCVSGSTADDDGDSVTISYGWKIDGGVISVTSSSLDGASFDKGDTVSCFVTPNDGTDDGTAVDSSGVLIGNTAPVLDSVSLSPTTPYTLDNITATVGTVTDADGDSITYGYQWFVDGVEVTSATSATLNYSNTDKYLDVFVRVTPNDGSDDGAAVDSDTVTVINTPPTAPIVEISPAAPQPEDNLTCTVTTASSDDDGDSVSYSYAWLLDGASSGRTGDTLAASHTAHGDSWTCVVTPNDGDEDGPTASDTVEVYDLTAPDQPLISSIDPLRNDTTVALEGTAEAGSTVTVYMECDDGTLDSTSTSADSSGLWSTSMTVPTGALCDFYAYAEDAYGNISPVSNTVSTESCNPVDDYEDSTGLGDTCADAIEDWSILPDDGTTVTLTGNIIDSTDEDWYVFDSSQSVTTSGYNVYNFQVSMTTGSTDYAFAVYRGGCGAGTLECGSSEGDGWTDYSYFAEDVGDGDHTPPSYSNYCADSSWYNNCDDLSSIYYVHVWRTSAVDSCAYYQLQVSNGG